MPLGPGRWAIISGEFFLAVSRLYLFYEGTALNEVSKEKAKIAFRLSVIMSVALALYGIVIYNVNPNFQNYALALFLMLQMGIAFVEWVFASRTGEQVNTVLSGLQSEVNEGLSRINELLGTTKDQAKDLQDHVKRIDLLSKENARQASRILELEQGTQKASKALAKLINGLPKPDRFAGSSFCICPVCLENGFANVLHVGPTAKRLVCDIDGWFIEVPKSKK